ncbi:hypothetical protein BDR04DRAFT_1097106, partial [Suillus decipiens]
MFTANITFSSPPNPVPSSFPRQILSLLNRLFVHSSSPSPTGNITIRNLSKQQLWTLVILSIPYPFIPALTHFWYLPLSLFSTLPCQVQRYSLQRPSATHYFAFYRTHSEASFADTYSSYQWYLHPSRSPRSAYKPEILLDDRPKTHQAVADQAI